MSHTNKNPRKMLIYLPGGYTANIPESTVAVGAYGTAAYPPVLESALMGAVTSGSMNPFLTQTFGTLLVQNASGTTVAWARMDSQSAATDAFNNIGIALEADAQAIIIASDGTYSVAS